MKYVKIRGKSYNEAMSRLRSEHGDEAIPISHKYVKEGGIMNSKFFSKQVVELTAGIPERKAAPKKGQESRRIDFTVGDRDVPLKTGSPDTGRKEKKSASPGRDYNLESISRTIDALNSNLNTFITKEPEAERKIGFDQARDTDGSDILKRLIQSREEELKDESAAIEVPAAAAKEEALPPVKTEKKEEKHLPRAAAEKVNHEIYLRKYDDLLKMNDFDTVERKTILTSVTNSISNDDLKDQFRIEKTLKDLLSSRIVTTGPIRKGVKKKLVMFVGPTGVGKTTTMAKLGAIHSLREGHRVVFITIDNYRIAATEQLKKYAEIMQIPIYSVNDAKEFHEVVEREKADIIMVDTSGRSHKNQVKIREINEFTNLDDYDIDKYLCVSANVKKGDLEEIFKAFDVVNFSSIIITKVDETSFVGNVVDIADKYNKPISYFTYGQEVPNDIEIADNDKIVNMMFNNTYN